MLTFIYITNNLKLARIAFDAGVDRIFVDLEVHGKHERQGHLDTVISGHTMDDVKNVRKSLPDAELLVRLNPVYSNTKREVDEAVEFGADLVMLPMFHTLDEIKKLCDLAQGRVGVVPLLETAASIEIAGEISKIKGVVELYVGLNDLHVDLKNNFIFQPLADGVLDPVASMAKQSGLRFGFGGIARIGEGTIPGEMVLGEHLRLGSDSVILSRTFYRDGGPSMSNSDPEQVFNEEVQKLRAAEKSQSTRTQNEVEQDHNVFINRVYEIINEKR